MYTAFNLMKKMLFALSLLAAAATAPLASAVVISPLPGGGADVRFRDRDIPQESEHARLVSTSQEVKVEHGGEVLVTKRVFLGPDGQQFVKESRERIDR
jgi:hypothetical protein